MTDERIFTLLQDIEQRLEALHAEILVVRESVSPDMAAIIAMHAGQPVSVGVFTLTEGVNHE